MIGKKSILTLFLGFVLIFWSITLTGCPPPPPDPLFSFAVIADPHITGGPGSDNAIRLSDCVDWINTNQEAYDIRFAPILGDIAWRDGFGTLNDILSELSIPWIPVVGDNVIHAGDEANFDTNFAPQYAYLSTVLDNWQKTPNPVWNPELEYYSYFQNFAFDYDGLHILGIDWVTRQSGDIIGEQADLHDFTGGTLPWFINDITNCEKDSGENIIMLSHHPMHISPGAFDANEDNTVETFTGTFGDHVALNLAGHYHFFLTEYRSVGQYAIYITEATKEFNNSLGLVRVYNDGTLFSYHYEQIAVPTAVE